MKAFNRISRWILLLGWYGAAAGFLAPAQDSARRILVLGDSLSAGYGIGKEFAFPALLQQRIEDRDWAFEVVNAGVSGDTSAGGLARLDWVLREPVHVLILELGANDGLRGIPVEVTAQNLQAIIDRVKQRFPGVQFLLAGMKLPPNWGSEYTRDFEAMYVQLAERNQCGLIPFLLEGVAGNPNLNLGDRIHPTAEGHRVLADNVWRHLEPILQGMIAP